MIINKKQYFAYRSFWPEIETMKKFRKCGIDTFMFMVSNVTNSLGLPYTKYPPVWKWNNTYDLTAFDQQIGDILEAIPDAKLICMIDLNTPHWWTRYLGAFGVRYDSFYELGKISASQTWRQDTLEYLKTLLHHAEKNYSDNLEAYILGVGGAMEWHDRSRGEESIYRLTAYREWQQKNGKQLTDIPSRMVRDTGAYDFDNNYVEPLSYYNGIDPTGCHEQLFPNGFGLMRTPGKNQEALDYWRFCNEFNTETAKFFLKETRKSIGSGKELGMFFGYAFGYWTMTAGHLAYEQLLDSPDLDFTIAPISYCGRGMGRGSTCRMIRESVRLRGKRMLQKMDQRTYTANHKLADFVKLPDPLKNAAEKVKWDNPTDSRELTKKFCMATDGIWKNDMEIIAGIKRETAYCLINGDSLWWFDMWGDFYKGKDVFATFKQAKKIWDSYKETTAHEVSEILLVVDPDNMYLINDMDARSTSFINKPLEALSTVSLPYTICSFNDLEQLEMQRFKLVIFSHPFDLSNSKYDSLKKYVLNNNRTVIWLYGPGIVNHGEWAPENVKKICGSAFGSEKITEINMGTWTSIYVSVPDKLNAEYLQQTALKAGCHVYCLKQRPVFANSSLVAIHTRIAESLKLELPSYYAKITELFSNKKFENTNSIKVDTTGPDTLLFLCEETITS